VLRLKQLDNNVVENRIMKLFDKASYDTIHVLNFGGANSSDATVLGEIILNIM